MRAVGGVGVDLEDLRTSVDKGKVGPAVVNAGKIECLPQQVLIEVFDDEAPLVLDEGRQLRGLSALLRYLGSSAALRN